VPVLPAIGFVAIATLLAGLLVGLVPALHALSEAGRIEVAGRLLQPRRRLHPGLVITEIALAVLLVIGAGLLGRSLVALRSVPLGYDLERVLTFEVRLPDTRYGDADAWRGYAESVRERLSALPGVGAAGVASRLPIGEGLGSAHRLWPAGAPEPDSTVSGTVVWATTPFFDAMGIPLVTGRGFAPGDRQSVLVSRSLAVSLFGRPDVVGEQLRMRYDMRAEPDLVTISGVTGDTRMTGYETDVAAILYLPWSERPVPWLAFAVRSAGDPAELASAVRGAVTEVDPAVAPLRLTTTGDAASRTIATRRALTLAAALFGATALMLALLGTYGLLAQSVARRRRELGIRMAVGARGRDVIRMVLGEAGALAAAGAALGAAAAFAATRLLSSLLWIVEAGDPLTFIAVTLLVMLAALIAAALPARRAARIDPARTLRSD
jgi:putative ABC transport system permease protein